MKVTASNDIFFISGATFRHPHSTLSTNCFEYEYEPLQRKNHEQDENFYESPNEEDEECVREVVDGRGGHLALSNATVIFPEGAFSGPCGVYLRLRPSSSGFITPIAECGPIEAEEALQKRFLISFSCPTATSKLTLHHSTDGRLWRAVDADLRHNGQFVEIAVDKFGFYAIASSSADVSRPSPQFSAGSSSGCFSSSSMI